MVSTYGVRMRMCMCMCMWCARGRAGDDAAEERAQPGPAAGRPGGERLLGSQAAQQGQPAQVCAFMFVRKGRMGGGSGSRGALFVAAARIGAARRPYLVDAWCLGWFGLC